MSRETLVRMARDVLSHGHAKTIAKADDFYKLPASVYFDKTRNQQEGAMATGRQNSGRVQTQVNNGINHVGSMCTCMPTSDLIPSPARLR